MTDINLGKITDSFIIDNQNKITSVNYKFHKYQKKPSLNLK